MGALHSHPFRRAVFLDAGSYSSCSVVYPLAENIASLEQIVPDVLPTLCHFADHALHLHTTVLRQPESARQYVHGSFEVFLSYLSNIRQRFVRTGLGKPDPGHHTPPGHSQRVPLAERKCSA